MWQRCPPPLTQNATHALSQLPQRGLPTPPVPCPPSPRPRASRILLCQLPTLDKLNNNHRGMANHLLHDRRVHRLMWVRHPVSRILSGWAEVRHQKSLSRSPHMFHKFVRHELVTERYSADCSKKSQKMSTHALLQHVYPAQHCRCGLPCNISWRVFKLEETDIRQGLRPYLTSATLPKSKRSLHARWRRLPECEYFPPHVLQELNSITMREQHFFGYTPYSVNMSACNTTGATQAERINSTESLATNAKFETF